MALSEGAKVVAITVHFKDSSLDSRLDRKRLEGEDEAIFMKPSNRDLGKTLLQEFEDWALKVFDPTMY